MEILDSNLYPGQNGHKVENKLPLKPLNIVIQKEWYKVENVSKLPNTLFIFGDNLFRFGKGGQAQIRDCPNSTGLATKRAPGMEEIDFFNDELYSYYANKITNDIQKILLVYYNNNYDTIVFPYAGLGTGLSKLPEKAPILNNFLAKSLKDVFGINTNPDGSLYL